MISGITENLLPIVSTITSMILLIITFKKINSTEDNVYGYIDENIQKLVNFYIAEKQDFIENAPKIIAGALHAPVMSQLGKMSGISRQMKGLENDMIADGIAAATGRPELAPLAAKYIKKYPIIRELAPILMQGRAQNVQTSARGGEGYG